jgi:hypothetical protein
VVGVGGGGGGGAAQGWMGRAVLQTTTHTPSGSIGTLQVTEVVRTG